MMDSIIELSPAELVLCSLLLVVNAGISLHLNLGLAKSLLVAAIRMVIQLGALGYVLQPLFAYNKWWMVIGYSMFMLVVASAEAVKRPQYTYKGVFLNTMLSMGAVSATMFMYVVFVVMQKLTPWYSAQYFIPIMGMVLGNATSSISVGLAAALDELAASRDSLEQLLSLGATRDEAVLPTVRRSIQKAATPIINTMSMLGLVSIPGMMTGQILSGSDPGQAARYQMMIMFLISSTSALSASCAVYLAVYHVVDDRHCYRPDRLIKNHKAPVAGQLTLAGRLQASVERVGHKVGSHFAAMAGQTRTEEEAALVAASKEASGRPPWWRPQPPRKPAQHRSASRNADASTCQAEEAAPTAVVGVATASSAPERPPWWRPQPPRRPAQHRHVEGLLTDALLPASHPASSDHMASAADIESVIVVRSSAAAAPAVQAEAPPSVVAVVADCSGTPGQSVGDGAAAAFGRQQDTA